MHGSIGKLGLALVGGIAALATAAPLAPAQADQPLRLDTAQLDAVSAGAFAGVAVFGQSDAFGTLNSQSSTVFNGQTTSSPAFSSASATVSSYAFGLGGTGANTPTANADTAVVDAQGDLVVERNRDVERVGRGFAVDYSFTYVGAFSSEFPINR